MKMTKVYLDMDGVLADFFGKWDEVLGFDHHNIKSQEEFMFYSDKFIKNKPFFLELECFDHSKALTKEIYDIFNTKPSILSNPIAGTPEETIKQKTQWLEQHIGLNNLSKLEFTAEKQVFAQGGQILIDDYLPNLEKWAKAGGIGIKYKAKSKKYDFNDLILALHNAKKISAMGIKGTILFLR